MTRPQIIRADTIDLQDRISPSAKDHTKQPTHPAALGAGPAAPHQAETLRGVAAEAEEEQHRSPRVSNDWNESDVSDHVQGYSDEQSSSTSANSLTGANLQQQDALAIAQNGGLTGAEDAEMADAEGDDILEDDMMEKMSSSPSIDDGGYSNPLAWPERLDSLSRAITPKKPFSSSEECAAACSSSPFVETPEYFPLHAPPLYVERIVSESEVDSPLHQYGSSSLIGEDSSADDEESRDILGPLPDKSLGHVVESYDDDEEYSAEELFAVQPDLDLYGCIEDDLGSEVMMIPYESSEEEDYDDVPYPEDPRFVDSGWGGECLQDLEDIDFDLVYALHTFVATVEGQANATKGDTMVLLDDSNSYWWLVRVVKDSSIGYLPAEHIETPTERLARLNKHRNIDLSATMLGDKDQSEKSKNPLKKAIRRRNAKTVTFAAPTYVEASEAEYSSDDEDGEREYFSQMKQVSQQVEQEDARTATVEAPIANAEVKDIEKETTENLGRMDDAESLKASSEIMRSSDEIFDGKSESSSSKSRNGTVRNTDSFFKDDSVETRKITLTPNLLRDDSSTSTRTSNDSKETRQRATPDKLERDLALDKSKEDKKKKEKKDREKEKEKKPGMLSNLFKRNKKGRNTEDDADELIYGKKSLSENSRSSPVPSKDSDEFPAEEQAPQPRSSPQRQTSKLQKQPRVEPRIEPLVAKRDILKTEARVAESQPRSAPPERPAPSYSPADPPLRLFQADTRQSIQPTLYKQATPSDTSRDLSGTLDDQRDKSLNTVASQTLRVRRVVDSEPGPEGNGAEFREDPHGFSSSADVSPADDSFKESARQAPQKPSALGVYPDSHSATPTDEKADDASNERLSESPVQISPVDASHSNPPALMVDTSSQEEAPSPASSPSPELVDVDEVRGKKSSENSISTPTSNSTWSDAHLRTFFDDDTDIKDLLVVVYDKSGVVPAGPDHPITGKLFKAENDKLADINNRLNNMLGDWLARKAKASVVR